MSARPSDTDTDVARPRTDWGRVADGVFLVGLGAFFLVATSRGLPDGFWIEAVSFWPVLLVSAGIRIVFEKTALSAGVVLGPAVVLATLFWLAWGDTPTPLPPGEWHRLEARAPEGTRGARLNGKLAGVQVDLETRPLDPAFLARGRAASREGTPELRVEERDGETGLRLKGRRGGFLMLGTRREVWELALTDAFPLEIDLSGVFIRTRADLRTGRVVYAEVSGAFNATSLRLPRTNAPVTIRLKGAFSTFDVTVPEGTPVRVHGASFPINYLDKGPAQDGISDEEPGYNLVVEAAFCVTNVEEGPPPAGGWPLPPRLEPPPLPAESPGDSDGASALEREASPGLPAEAPPGP